MDFCDGWNKATLLVGAVAAVITLIQIHRHNQTARVNRTLELQKDLTESEVAHSRELLSRQSWNGNHFVKPSFGELNIPAVSGLPRKDNISREPVGETLEMTYLDHYFRILWCFQRVKGALEHNTLDKKLSRDLFTRHIVWWSTFSGRMDRDDTSLIMELNQIIPLLARRPWYLFHTRSKSYITSVRLMELEVSQEFAATPTTINRRRLITVLKRLMFRWR